MKWAVVLVIALLLSAPAVAEETGTRIKKAVPLGRPDTSVDVHKLRIYVDAYATCSVKRSRATARTFVVNLDARPITDGECLSTDKSGYYAFMRFPGDSYRYALAQALIRADYPQGLPSDVTAARPLANPKPEPLDEAKLPKNREAAALTRQRSDWNLATWGLRIVGECVARADSAAAYALSRTDIDSPAEKSAIGTLMPVISGCLPEGGTFQFDRANLRGAIVTCLYRLSYSVRKPTDA